MDRTLMSLGIAAVVLAVGYFSLFMGRDSAGEEYRLEAREMMRQVEGYSSRPEYYDFLVDWAHDEVFNDAYVMEPRGRRRVEVWVDEGKYYHDLFLKMMERAGQDNVPHVVTALQKFKAGIDAGG